MLVIYLLHFYLFSETYSFSVFQKKYNIIYPNYVDFCKTIKSMTSIRREFNADARYFYGNRITHVFNKICTFESTALLKLLKPQSSPTAKPRSWLPVSNQLIHTSLLPWYIVTMLLFKSFKQIIKHSSKITI